MNFFGFSVRPRSIAFLLAIVLASCGSRCQRGEEPGSSKTVHLFVWGEYTSKALFDRFTAQTGIDVVESNFASNEELLAKLQAGADGYDLIIPSDYMVQVMAELGLLLHELRLVKSPAELKVMRAAAAVTAAACRSSSMQRLGQRRCRTRPWLSL